MTGTPASRAASVGPAERVDAPTAVAPADDRPARAIATASRPRDYILRRALATADLVALAVAAVAAAAVAPPGQGPELVWLLALLPAWLVLLRLYGLYERDVKCVGASHLDDVPALFHAFVIGTLGSWACMELASQRGAAASSAVVFGLVGLGGAIALRTVARAAVLAALGPSRVLLVGDDGISGALVRKLHAHREYGLDPVGRLAVSSLPEGDEALPCLGLLGDVDLGELLRRRRVDRVLVASSDLPEEPMMALIEACGAAGVKVSLVPDHVAALGPSVTLDDIEGMTLLGLNPLVLSRSSRFLKRSFDIAGATVGLTLALPLLAVLAVAIRLDSPGPALFRQRRVGRRGKPFQLLKFRTMVVGAEEQGAALRALSHDPDWLKLERDPRVTRAGRLLRSTSLDELPQLWNVLRGEMSLVGPRPLVDSEDRLIAGWSRARLDLSPGITGLWQVLGRTEIPFREMVTLDYLYVTNWSLWLDVKLILRTIPAVLARRGAN